MKSLLPTSVLTAFFAAMAIGVVPLEIVIALFPLVVRHAAGYHFRAHFDSDDVLFPVLIGGE